MTRDRPPDMKRQLIYVGLRFLSIGAVGVALYALTAAFRFVDVAVVCWYYFAGAFLLAILGLLGLELTTTRIKKM